MHKNNTACARPDQDALAHRPVTLTQFPDWNGYSKATLKITLPELADLIAESTAPEKPALPMLSGLTWGNLRSENRSLKHGPNAGAVHAIFIDYDAGKITPAEAVERLKALGLVSLVYTSPSHQMPGKGNRWRLVLPLSEPLPPDAYADLVARVNGVFGGALGDESFRIAQAYFFGSVKGQPPAQTFLSEGSRFIDQADDLDAQALGPSRKLSDMLDEAPQEAVDQSGIPEAVDHALKMLEWAKARVLEAAKKDVSRTEEIHRQAVHLGGYVACATLTEEQVRETLTEAAEKVGYLTDYSERDLDRHITNGLNSGISRPLPWQDPFDDLPDEGTAVLSAEELAEIDDLVGATTTDPAPKAKKPKVDRATARLNEKHAVVRHSGKTWIADFTGDQIELGPVEGLHAFYANDLVPAGGKGAMIPVSKHWITSPGRRTYDGIVFDPSGNAPENALNLYAGLAVQPDPHGSCKRIVAHIRDVIAAGNEAHFRYVIGWLADLVQNPGQKPGVALVLRGGKGVGKDTLAEIMGRIIGRKHVAHIIRADDLTGRFNAPFATALLVHVEEAFWSGDVSKKGTLQALITARTQPIERKGIDRVEVDSFLRLLMTTNDEWAVPASEDERRYAVFDVSDAHQRDPEWFGPLYAEIEGGGPAAFLSYLLAVDLSGFNVRDVPQTEALRDQKIASLRGVPHWWFEVLDKGGVAEFGDFGDWSGPITVEKDAVRASYEARERQSRFGSDPVNPAVFTKELKRLLADELREVRPRVNGKRVCMFVFPSLVECRTKFAGWLQAPVRWGDDDAGEDDDPEADALI
ncbi:DUF5906 domain-containing protein [Celeribacter baekdonensis]|uniref:DUF5906 domain-containing protein n=1 Tax=Celeribacter baekdonensis TaxID=875171 RepID=UPI0030D6DEFE|tara:strand:- start:248862 stop:251285 length:2424 start_codon:yes stop_codon:yes gene_type:complete